MNAQKMSKPAAFLHLFNNFSKFLSVFLKFFFAEIPKSLFAVKHKTQLRKGNAKVVFICFLPPAYLISYKI